MSTDFHSPPQPGLPSPSDRTTTAVFSWSPPPLRPKFQHRYRKHIVLFVLTLLTTSFAPAFEFFWSAVELGVRNPTKLVPLLATGLSIFTPRVFAAGLSYSLPLLTILGAHEFGHYLLCRRYNVDATLPFFIPLPLPPTGTLGAVIRIREAFPSKRALFDIGVAGPIAGFLALLPFLYIGIGMSHLVPMTDPSIGLRLGDPLLAKAVVWLWFGPLPSGYDVVLHPMGFAAWWGMLATALNLMPFGQLDGGHIIYSIVGRRAAMVSVATLASAVFLTTRSFSWISMTVMMLVMAYALGLHHPRVIDEDTPLDLRRRLVAVFGFVIFAVCFTPVPIQTFFGK